MQVGVLEVVSEDTSKHHELSERAEYQEPITQADEGFFISYIGQTPMEQGQMKAINIFMFEEKDGEKKKESI